MKKVILVMVGLVAATSAQAAALCPHFVAIDATCRNLQTARNYTQVRIQSGGCGAMVATIYGPNPTDAPVALASFDVTRRTNPGRPGAPMLYVGQGFELSINVDSPSLPQGGRLSHLLAEVHGQRYSVDMICQ